MFKQYLEDFHEIIHYIVVTYAEKNRHVKPDRFPFTESKSSTVWGIVYAEKGDAFNVTISLRMRVTLLTLNMQSSELGGTTMNLSLGL